MQQRDMKLMIVSSYATETHHATFTTYTLVLYIAVLQAFPVSGYIKPSTTAMPS